uniref:Uncharacterized protein n=1 Tax=Anopheles merus TaxID=30066 RepID=A0A182VLI2_ANOME
MLILEVEPRVSCWEIWRTFENVSAYDVYSFCFCTSWASALDTSWSTSLMRFVICCCSEDTCTAHVLKCDCSRLHMLIRWVGCSRSSTSGSRFAGSVSVPRITGRNIGTLCSRTMSSSFSMPTSRAAADFTTTMLCAPPLPPPPVGAVVGRPLPPLPSSCWGKSESEQTLMGGETGRESQMYAEDGVTDEVDLPPLPPPASPERPGVDEDVPDAVGLAVEWRSVKV